jgi:hypothetical protein
MTHPIDSGGGSLLSSRSVDGTGGGGDGSFVVGASRPPSPVPRNWVWVMGNGGLWATVPDHLAREVGAVEVTRWW